ncbi:hypothetical protein M569_14773, partial [Genlisea aurea]
ALLGSEEKFAKITVFVQDVGGGRQATIWEVAHAAITGKSKYSFGKVSAVDDLLTAGPDKSSQALGRLQGTFAYTGLNETSLTANINFHLTSGPYSGSTLCVAGRNPVQESNRELPLVGGTGVFRAARGYAIVNTISFDKATNYAVLQYTFYVSY